MLIIIIAIVENKKPTCETITLEALSTRPIIPASSYLSMFALRISKRKTKTHFEILNQILEGKDETY